MTKGIDPTQEIREYWHVAHTDKGKCKGPLHLVIKVLRAAGVIAGDPVVWDLPGRPSTDIRKVHDFPDLARHLPTRAVWRSLAKDRHHYKGMMSGCAHP